MNKYAQIINNNINIANSLDEQGLFEFANYIDESLEKLAVAPAVKLADAFTIINAITVATSRLLTEIVSLKNQGQTVLPVQTIAKMESTKIYIGNAISRLNNLLQTGSL